MTEFNDFEYFIRRDGARRFSVSGKDKKT